MKFFLFFAVLLCLVSRAFGIPDQFNFADTDNTVSFRALGKPSSLHINGKVKDGVKNPLDGKVQFLKNEAQGVATFPLDQFETGISLRDKHMKEKYLEVSQFPTAKLNFVLKKVPDQMAMNASEFEVAELPLQGDLTLHGKTKKVEGTYKIERHGKTFCIDFNFAINLKDFEIAVPSFMGVTVADVVNVSASVETKVEDKT